MLRLAFLSIVFVSSHIALASPDDTVRVRYDKFDQPPDHVFLPVFLDAVTQAQEGVNGNNYQEVSTRMNIKDPDEANAIFLFLVNMNSKIVAQHNDFRRQSLCPFDKPRPSGPKVYEVLDSIDDEWDNIGRSYLRTIKVELGDRLFGRFLRWMHLVKRHSTIIRFDHARLYAGRNADLLRQEICGEMTTN